MRPGAVVIAGAVVATAALLGLGTSSQPDDGPDPSPTVMVTTSTSNGAMRPTAAAPTTTVGAEASVVGPGSSVPPTMAPATTPAPASTTTTGGPAYASSTAAVGPGTPYPLTHSWREGCPVGPASLRALRFTHWDFAGAQVTGVVIVHADAVAAVDEAMRRAHDARFAIRQARPVDDFGGSDDESMAADNTSAFNCRRVKGSSSWSQHSYGRAIDINPIENPYVQGSSVDPPAGAAYADRSDVRPGMIVRGDAVTTAFAAMGWGWGGSWSSGKDYQHFSATGR